MTPPQPPTRRRRVLSTLAQVGLLVLLYLGISTWQTRQHLRPSQAPAPDFTLPALDGSTVNLASLRGKTVVLHFWATWCAVCKLEIDSLKSLEESLGPNQVLISVVADGEDAAKIRAFVADRAITYPVLLADEKVVSDYRVSAFPTTYFLSPEGQIVSSTVGLSNRFAYRVRMGCAR